jgi:hypothetical protein
MIASCDEQCSGKTILSRQFIRALRQRGNDCVLRQARYRELLRPPSAVRFDPQTLVCENPWTNRRPCQSVLNRLSWFRC